MSAKSEKKALQLAVAAAEKAAKEKKAELVAATELVKRLEREYGDALAGIRRAREDADAMLPQCRLIAVKWRSGTEVDVGRVVILRKTPTGILVVRRVGADNEIRFKFSEHRGFYSQVERPAFFASDRSELRDVPPEYAQQPK